MAGAMARYAMALALQNHSLVFPFGTLGANLAGCFLIGVISQLAAVSTAISPEIRLLLATGFCGGFTTLSSMIFELDRLLRDGELYLGSLYLLGTLLGGYLGLILGMLAVRLILR